MHPLAFKAAEAAHCAGEQGKYWEMHDHMFENQKDLANWGDHAAAIGLDVEAFTTCLDSGRHAEAIREDMVTARKAGASGTPGFLIARTDPYNPNKVKGISTLRGAQPFATFKAALDQALQDDPEKTE